MAKKRRRGTPLKQEKVRFGEVRREQRARTISVKYHVKYRDRNTGRFTKFVANKSLNPVLFHTIVRRGDRTFTAQVTRGGKPVVLPARKAKRAITGAGIARIVESRVLVRKIPKRRLESDATGAFIVYPAQVRAKQAPKKKKVKRPKRLKKGGGRPRGKVRVKK